MKQLLFATAMLMAALPSAALARSFDCTFDPAIGTSLKEGQFSQKPVNFKDMKTPWVYRFTLDSTKPGKSVSVDVSSKEDFATIAGKYQALVVAPETYFFTAVKTGNCMFSSELCGASIQLTNLESDNAVASITPISYFGDQREAEFFHVHLLGKCKKIESVGSEK